MSENTVNQINSDISANDQRRRAVQDGRTNNFQDHADTDSAAVAVVGDDIGDYVADEQTQGARELALDAQYASLQQSARSAASQMLAGNRVFYGHLVDLLLFWHDAREGSYLSDLIAAKSNKAYKARVAHGINFAPLIDVVWADIDCPDMPHNKSNRLSRALNTLNEIFGRKFNFAPSARAQLIEYIEENGGVNGLVNYKPAPGEGSEDSVPDYKADRDSAAAASELMKASTKKAYSDSVGHLRQQSNLPAVQFPCDIVVNDDDMALVLVSKRDATSFNLVGSLAERDQVARVLTRSYLGDFTVLPPAVRVIFETLATQCCPGEHQGTYAVLLNETARSSDTGQKSALRRLVYRHAKSDFLLSNTGSESGVVTIAKPKIAVLAGALDDTMLATSSRRMLERYLISPRNLRSIKFESAIGKNAISQMGTPFTHGIRLSEPVIRSGVSETRIAIQFHRESMDRPMKSQVDIDGRSPGEMLWTRTVPAAWLKQFNAAFTDNWVDSHARHVNRPHQSILQLQCRHSELTVNFFNLENQFELSVPIAVPPGSDAVGHRREFLSKDFAVVMLQLATLPIISEVAISLFSGCLKLEYETDVGSYCIVVPAVSSNGQRTGPGFTHYTMQCVIPDESRFDELSNDEATVPEEEGVL